MTFPFAVTGGRDYRDRGLVFVTLDAVRKKHPDCKLLVGDAHGADEHAVDWAKARRVPFQVFEADWVAMPGLAGGVRNGQIVSAGPRGLVAFPGGSGTADMTRRCREAGVPVWSIK